MHQPWSCEKFRGKKGICLTSGWAKYKKTKHKPGKTEKVRRVLRTGPAEGKNPESAVLSSQVDTADNLSLGFLSLLSSLLLLSACPWLWRNDDSVLSKSLSISSSIVPVLLEVEARLDSSFFFSWDSGTIASIGVNAHDSDKERQRWPKCSDNLFVAVESIGLWDNRMSVRCKVWARDG